MNNLFPFPLGDRTNAVNLDFSDILPEDVEEELKTTAEISMGTEIAEEDIMNIKSLCNQVNFVFPKCFYHLICGMNMNFAFLKMLLRLPPL